MLQRTLNRKVQVPIFHGKANEDPRPFIKKAQDYMMDAAIPDAQCTQDFKHCLDGKAHL